MRGGGIGLGFFRGLSSGSSDKSQGIRFASGGFVRLFIRAPKSSHQNSPRGICQKPNPVGSGLGSYVQKRWRCQLLAALSTVMPYFPASLIMSVRMAIFSAATYRRSRGCHLTRMGSRLLGLSGSSTTYIGMPSTICSCMVNPSVGVSYKPVYILRKGKQ